MFAECMRIEAQEQWKLNKLVKDTTAGQGYNTMNISPGLEPKKEKILVK